MQPPVKEKYKENNIEYFSFHMQVARAFQVDLEKLLLTFKLARDLFFNTYAAVWRNMKFSLVFCGIDDADELRLFIQSCFTIIKKYIMFSKDIYIRAGAFYTLYSLYYKQPMNMKIKIWMTPEVFTELETLVKKLKQRCINDGLYIFKKLQLEGAFQISLFHNNYGIDNKFMWHESKLVDDTFQSVKKGNPLLKVEAILNSPEYGLNAIDKHAENYVEGLREYGFSEEDCKKTEDFTKEIEDLMHEMLCLDPDINEPSTSTGTTTQAKLKEKAFSAKIKPFFEKK